MEKQKYIRPSIKKNVVDMDCLMDNFSLQTTGQVDNPSFGQAKNNVFFSEYDELECEGHLSSREYHFSVWDEE